MLLVLPVRAAKTENNNTVVFACYTACRVANVTKMPLTSCRYGCDAFRVLRYLGLLLLPWRDVRMWQQPELEVPDRWTERT